MVFGGHAIVRHQMTAEHLELFPILETDDIVGLDRRADRDGGLLLLDGRFDRRAKSRQRAMNARDQIWEIGQADAVRSEEHTSELQSLMRITYAVIYLKQKKYNLTH